MINEERREKGGEKSFKNYSGKGIGAAKAFDN